MNLYLKFVTTLVLSAALGLSSFAHAGPNEVANALQAMSRTYSEKEWSEIFKQLSADDRKAVIAHLRNANDTNMIAAIDLERALLSAAHTVGTTGAIVKLSTRTLFALGVGAGVYGTISGWKMKRALAGDTGSVNEALREVARGRIRFGYLTIASSTAAFLLMAPAITEVSVAIAMEQTELAFLLERVTRIKFKLHVEAQILHVLEELVKKPDSI